MVAKICCCERECPYARRNATLLHSPARKTSKSQHARHWKPVGELQNVAEACIGINLNKTHVSASLQFLPWLGQTWSYFDLLSPKNPRLASHPILSKNKNKIKTTFISKAFKVNSSFYKHKNIWTNRLNFPPPTPSSQAQKTPNEPFLYNRTVFPTLSTFEKCFFTWLHRLMSPSSFDYHILIPSVQQEV